MTSLRDVLAVCDSPIERIMAIAIDRVMREQEGFANGYMVLTWDIFGLPAARPCSIKIFPQAKIGPYKADFLAKYTEWDGVSVLAAIECDGHDYHDLTREQAIHDRRRDRYFQANGILIFRFTGSEIFSHPLETATAALEAMDQAALSKWRDLRRAI